MSRRLYAVLLAAALASGCASGKTRPSAAGAAPAVSTAAVQGAGTAEPTVVGASTATYRDPLIHVNRVVFAFNDVTYRYLLIPISQGYIWLLPEPARKGVGNFFHNLKTPVYLANDLLQLKPKPFGRHLARFLVNSTLGLGGLFDPARAWFKLEKTRTGFADTLARYGAGYGVYIVLPIFGSSDLRGGAGLVADYFLNPIPYLLDDPEKTAVMSYDNFQEYAPSAEKYKTLRRELKDPYIFFRNLHLQGVQRDAEH